MGNFKIEKCNYKGIKVPNSLYYEGMDPFTIGVLICLMSFGKETIDINAEDISSEAGCGTYSVTRALYRLESIGHLERSDPRDEHGYKHKSQYRIHINSTGIDYYFQRTGKKYSDKRLEKVLAYKAELLNEDNVKTNK